MSSLPAIPVIDIREGGVVRHASENPERARALRDGCIGWFPDFIRQSLAEEPALAPRRGHPGWQDVLSDEGSARRGAGTK